MQVGLGRLGGEALTFASDLDIVYLFSGTHEAELTLSGGSTLELEVADAINVTASGGSTLTIIGRPTVRSLELSGGSTLDFE